MVDMVFRAAYSSIAVLTIFSVQDILKLDNSARMNFPSSLGNNWKWRLLPGQFTPELAKRIHRLTQITARIAK